MPNVIKVQCSPVKSMRVSVLLTLFCFYFRQTSADATIYVGGLDDKVTDTLLWELFVQAGSVGNLFK